jgi:hypothetical protein
MARKRHPPKPDLDEPLSLYPLDPEDVLRRIVQEPDKKAEETEEPTKP